MKNQTAEREIDVRVFVYAPVGLPKVAVHRLVDVQHEALGVAHGFVAGTVEDVCLCDFHFLGLNQYVFYDVLNFFDCGNGMCAATCQKKTQFLFHAVGKCDCLVRIRALFNRFDCLSDGILDFFAVIDFQFAVALYYLFDERLCFLITTFSQKTSPLREDRLFTHFFPLHSARQRETDPDCSLRL